MNVKELRELIRDLPDNAQVHVVGDVGCNECNPEAHDIFVGVHKVTLYQPQDIPYPNKKFRTPGEQVVVIA